MLYSLEPASLEMDEYSNCQLVTYHGAQDTPFAMEANRFMAKCTHMQ